MSLNDISQALTPYPHWKMTVTSGVGNGVLIMVKSDALGELGAFGPNEEEASCKMVKEIEVKKRQQEKARYDI